MHSIFPIKVQLRVSLANKEATYMASLDLANLDLANLETTDKDYDDSYSYSTNFHSLYYYHSDNT